MNIKKQITNLTSKDAWITTQAVENIILYGNLQEIQEALQVAKKTKVKPELVKLLAQQVELEQLATS